MAPRAPPPAAAVEAALAAEAAPLHRLAIDAGLAIDDGATRSPPGLRVRPAQGVVVAREEAEAIDRRKR
ncbi:MAG TPA: hypothetical protein VGW38_25625 [Chloroflexota bacterium]|nr:hypothetical protein [Chloroflexota bacterium]